MAGSGWPDHSLSHPLITQPRAKLGLSARARSTIFYGDIDVFTKIGENVCRISEDKWVVTGTVKRSSSEIDAFAVVRFWIFIPAVNMEILVASCRQKQVRDQMCIALDCLSKEVERLDEVLLPPSESMRQGAQIKIISGRVLRRALDRTTNLAA